MPETLCQVCCKSHYVSLAQHSDPSPFDYQNIDDDDDDDDDNGNDDENNVGDYAADDGGDHLAPSFHPSKAVRQPRSRRLALL